MKRKRIVVNARLLLPNKLEGIGWFSHQVLRRITTNHPKIDFFFLFDRPFSEEFIYSKNITPIVISPPSRHPILWLIWFEWSVKNAIKKIKPDLFFSPDGFLCLNTSVKSLPVIHDINFFHAPYDLAWSHQKYYNYFFPKYAHKASRIATVSEFSKNDMVTYYGLDKNKIDVVYNGIHEFLNPLEPQKRKEVRNKNTFGEPYFLFIGSIHPRKNIVRMLQAFDMFKKETNSSFKLIIAGNKKWWTSDMDNTFVNMEYEEDVILKGRISQEEYAELLPSAFALLYVSIFEGFGIPIIEAMKCKVPVITSNVSSLPEICANSALLADPFSVESICAQMKALYTGEELRTSLIEKGEKRALDFSWDKTADLVWKSIEKIL